MANTPITRITLFGALEIAHASAPPLRPPTQRVLALLGYLIVHHDVPQAREYVEKVVAAYWIYQRLNGRPLNTLDAVASGATLVPLSLDYVPPAPVQPMEVASAPATSG